MKNITKLEDTIDMMLSEDHFDRLLAEYYQLRIRYQRLEQMLNDYDNGNLGFQPDTPIHILKEQLNIMHDYLLILNHRLHLEA